MIRTVRSIRSIRSIGAIVTASLSLLAAGATRAAADPEPFIDTDGDGCDDNWEVANFGNITLYDGFSDPDGDGANNLVEYREITDPLTYDGPTAPIALSPACNSTITTLQTSLVVENATDPQGTPLLYELQLSSDPAFTVTVAATNPLLAQGAAGTTTWPVPVNLVENGRYYWRARARDPYTFGPPALCSFLVNLVNEPPSMPTIASPAFGAHVPTLTPTLVVHNAVDPDHDVLRYELEVYADPALSLRVAQTPSVAEGLGTTSWRVDNASPPLMEDRFYYWRARAHDPHGLASSWSASGMFFVSTTNAPPEPPSIVSPQNGTIVGELRPPLVVLDADDADLDPLVYDWDLATDVQFTTIVASGIDVPAADGQDTRFLLATDLAEDHRYCWRVRSDDGQATSPYSIACFLVSQANDPPDAPVAINPSPLEVVTTRRPVFSWLPASDPEEEAVTYELEVLDGDGRLLGAQAEIAGTTSAIAGDLLDGVTHTWRVRARDRQGLAGPYSADQTFQVELPGTDCCASDGGCRSSPRPGAGGALAVLAAGLLALRPRRSRSPRA